MTSNDVMTARGAATLAAVLGDPARTLLALDFDGTIAPITGDPGSARPHPRAIDALERLAEHLGTIAVVTGRPVATAVRLGGFADRAGLGAMIVLGQYGVERWDAATGETRSPPPPAGIGGVDAKLPALLAELGLDQARVEHKGRAVVVHTRGLAEPDAAMDRLRAPLSSLAGRNGLAVEPGKQVLEIREPGTDKGDAIRTLVEESGARQVIFAGDDLGDLPAFDAVDELDAAGTKGLLVCSASDEQDALVARADVVVRGTAAVADWLTWLAGELDG